MLYGYVISFRRQFRQVKKSPKLKKKIWAISSNLMPIFPAIQYISLHAVYWCFIFSAPPCHYISVSDTDDDDDPDPQLTALLHEKVVQVKKEINWDEEERQHQERVRQKQALHYKSSNDSDSDDDDPDPQLTALLHEKVVRVKKEINWDEEERQHQERVRQKQALHYNSSNDSDSDDDRDPQLTALLHEKVVRVKKVNWDEEERQHQERVRQKQALYRDDSDSDDGDEKDLVPQSTALLHEKRVKQKKTINFEQEENPHQNQVRQNENHFYSSLNDNPETVSIRTSLHPRTTPVSLSPAWISDFCDPQSGYESCENQNKHETSSEDDEQKVASFSASPPTHEPVCPVNETELKVMLVSSPLNTQTVSQHCCYLHKEMTCPGTPAYTCHQHCHCSCNIQPQAPWPSSPYNYHACMQCTEAVSSCCYAPHCNTPFVKNSKRLLELDDCDISTVANGPQPKRHCSIVQVHGCFYT